MRQEYFITLLHKYVNNSASKEETRMLIHAVNSGKYDILLKQEIALMAEDKATVDISEDKAIDIFKNITESTDSSTLPLEKHEKQPIISLYKKPWFKYSVAASIVTLISIGVWFKNTNKTNSQLETSIIVNNQIKTGTNKATLTLGNGEEISLSKGITFQTKKSTSNGEEITYKPTTNQSATTSNKTSYNYLTIPRGGEFHLILSDGTQVWLNSETKLKYPVAFTKGEPREVELVYGEAYFDVSPSSEHHGSKFKVLNNAQEVEALGTEFNIKAYRDETTIYTTLVEGKVAVNNAHKSVLLIPNQQASLNTKNNNLSINNIDIKSEIAWRNGEFIIKGKNLKEIMKMLSRWYDMDVTIVKKDLEEVRFIGILRKNQNITDILNTIKSFEVINDYEINNKTLIVK
ncbi:MAG: FecR domain-containing protein [Algibacter sp.]|uniref:FecR family protein n=1 Tax=Algibacter sp. TaxID=1872428 RepID=UPI003298E0B2